jgi:hypothetical protein
MNTDDQARRIGRGDVLARRRKERTSALKERKANLEDEPAMQIQLKQIPSSRFDFNSIANSIYRNFWNHG